MDYQTFRTRKNAKAEAAKMRGWSVKVVKIYLGHDPYDSDSMKHNIDGKGNTWVIECNGNMYLRADGYVR